MTIHVFTRLIHIDPCPLCPDECQGHELREEARLDNGIWLWIPLEDE